MAKRFRLDAELVRRAMEQVLLDTPGFAADYVAVVDPTTLEPLERIDGPARGLIAARVGAVRLIDNMALG